MRKKRKIFLEKIFRKKENPKKYFLEKKKIWF
jgi:hypothetical protein